MSKPKHTHVMIALLAFFPHWAAAGEFETLEGVSLARLVKDPSATSRQNLSMRTLGSLPAILHDERSSFVVVATSQGNLARILISQALRKPSEGNAPPIPVVVLDRYDTFEPGTSGTRLARGSGIVLFDTFQIDLDTGQIVPPDQGGDLKFQVEGTDGPTIVTVGKAKLYTFAKAIVPESKAAGRTSGKASSADDFGGRYRLNADGRWSGLLELQVAQDHKVTGLFRSEPNGTSYPVSGMVSDQPPNKINFTIKFPRTEQDYEGYLWTEGKNALAGNFSMLGRSFGFFAVREGARHTPQD